MYYLLTHSLRSTLLAALLQSCTDMIWERNSLSTKLESLITSSTSYSCTVPAVTCRRDRNGQGFIDKRSALSSSAHSRAWDQKTEGLTCLSAIFNPLTKVSRTMTPIRLWFFQFIETTPVFILIGQLLAAPPRMNTKRCVTEAVSAAFFYWLLSGMPYTLCNTMKLKS